MKIDSLKDLKKLLQLCRQQGVQCIRLGGIEFHLGSLPKSNKVKSIDEDVFPEAQIKIPKFIPVVNESEAVLPDKIDSDELSEEQLLMWSAQGTNQ